MTTTRAPEVHPLLAEPDTPSLATLRSRAVHRIGEELNTLIELLTLVQNLKGNRQPDKCAPHSSLGDWARMVNQGNYAGARRFILALHT